MNLMTIGEKLQFWGVKKFGNKTNFAKEMAMSLPALSLYLHDKRRPGTGVLQKLKNLGCDVDWLLTKNEEAIINSNISVRRPYDSKNIDFERNNYNFSSSTEEYLENTIKDNKDMIEKLLHDDTKGLAKLMAVLFENARLLDENEKLKSLQNKD